MSRKRLVPQRPSPEPVSPEAINFVTNTWSRRVVQPMLISLLITPLIASFLVFLQLITNTSPWLWLSLLCFLVCLEGIYTSNWLYQPGQRIVDKMAYQAAELVILLLLTRLYTWLITGNYPQLALLTEYLQYPSLIFGDTYFVLGVLLVIVSWRLALDVASTFRKLAIDTSEAVYYLTPAPQRRPDERPVLFNRLELVGAFFQYWIWGGVAMVIMATLTTFDLPGVTDWGNPLAIARLGLLPEMLLALLVYFIAGFLLLSQARLAAANARWLREGAQKSEQVEHSWHGNSLWPLLIIAFLAALLPLGSTTGISRILEAVIMVISNILTVLAFLFLGLLALLIPSIPETETTPEAFTPQPLPTFAPQATPVPDDTVGIVFSSLFWAVALVFSIVAVSFFLRERGVRLKGSWFWHLWQRLSGWFQAARRGVSNRAASLQKSIRRRLRRPERRAAGAEKSPWKFIRLSALSPRDQIRYFYLSTVRRAGEKGVARRQSETPLEYAQDLKENFPEAETDVEELTDAFLKARYTPLPVEKNEVNPIKQRWKQLRRRLRQKKEKRDAGDNGR